MNTQGKEPGVNIHREWYELTKPLTEKDEKRWWRFFEGIITYALGESDRPDFSDDAELQDLWEKTNVRQCDFTKGKMGKLSVRKRRSSK